MILNSRVESPPPEKPPAVKPPSPTLTEMLPPMPNLVTGTREEQVRQWAFFLHISQLAGIVLPVAGLVVPILIWQLKKEEFPELDRHGKNALNWIISELIYAFACAVLALLLVGIPLLLALAVVGIAFPIMAAVKAQNGEEWRYPLAIEFIK
jgi:uncharacterized Tic20 family protein